MSETQESQEARDTREASVDPMAGNGSADELTLLQAVRDGQPVENEAVRGLIRDGFVRENPDRSGYLLTENGEQKLGELEG